MSAPTERWLVLLQHRETKMFLGTNDQWTAERSKARQFHNSVDALRYVMARHLSGTQIVLRLDTAGACDRVVPV
jgi:hypothetical protein